MTFSTTKKYHCKIEVRGYELDSFGHVNHAIYVNYLEHARWKLLQEEAITLEDFKAWKRWPVIVAMEVKYLKPTFMADTLEIITQVVDHGRTHFTFAHTIRRGEDTVITAQLQSVMINEKGRPASIPKEIYRLWTEDGADASETEDE